MLCRKSIILCKLKVSVISCTLIKIIVKRIESLLYGLFVLLMKRDLNISIDYLIFFSLETNTYIYKLVKLT